MALIHTVCTYNMYCVAIYKEIVELRIIATLQCGFPFKYVLRVFTA